MELMNTRLNQVLASRLIGDRNREVPYRTMALAENFKLEDQAVLSKHFIKQTLADNRDTLRKYGVKQIGLFGSYVNGTAHATSDIDLLVELEKSTFHDYMELVLFLEGLFEKKVDLVAVKSVKSDLKPYIEKQVEYVTNL